MASTIYDVLDELRSLATSEADKGSRFERLMKSYFRIDPVFTDQFSDVWLWVEYPGNNGKHDTGIDLVARDKDTGHDVAIQCKFFASTTTVSKPMIDSFLSASGKDGFGERIIVSTTDKWNANAEDAITGQAVPVRRIGMPDLEASRVDWSVFSLEDPEDLTLVAKKSPHPYQRVAIDKVVAGFGASDRGKLVMACGTGKTFTSLKLAEENVGVGGKVLFLVPSINLLSQSVREWVANADIPIRPLAVCSDSKAARKASSDAFEDISVTDLALPATTNVALLKNRINDADAEKASMTVVFATYQSIDVVAQAQHGLAEFDLIVADEAHRTTGATLAGESESAFVKVHDNAYLPAKKRIYMTATPRIYDDTTRAKAGQANAILASMDDEKLYGPELHRLGFGEAVELGLLTDYKVLVLTVDEESVARTFQAQLSDDSSELKLDDAAKIVGCWNGLAKRGKAEHSFEPDLRPMRRAIAFAGNIKDSKRVEELFQSVTDYYVGVTEQENSDGTSPLKCAVQHVDGTMNALERNQKLDWLKQEPDDGSCRILTNARCLSEGVDVPSLDAVMFLAPRKSVVDIVQSVGRVMRLDKKSGKQFGYIILPIGIPSGMTPEEALKDNKRYAAVWEVLQALRAHDERFDAMVNRLQLQKDRDKKVNVIGVGGDKESVWTQGQLQLAFGDLDTWRDAIYAKLVDKVGTRRYWTEWAKSVADIATRQTTRIHALLSDPTTGVREEFDAFLTGLRNNLNDGISDSDAIDMLAQHLITRPVFDALFKGSQFLAHNPVATTMERMLAALDTHNLDDENSTLEKFYDSVRMRVEGIDSAEGRQRIITELYDTFFSTAFKKTVDKLGIVYTPVEIVDFILRSADAVMRQEFGHGLTDEGVHVLDPFTGTGTFMVRLLQLGLIEPHDLARKYAEELHANEILLLAYYIAAVNIETTYYDVMTSIAEPGGGKRAAEAGHEYVEFPGLVLTDTFQSWEDDDRPDLDVFPENNGRLERLKKLPITVIVGNPPYSVGQSSANDDNANDPYPTLDAAIRGSYGALSAATSTRTLYDAYIRAIKWASMRITGGVVAFVTNSGWLTSNGFDGMRKSLAAEFTSVYVLNLRGNSRAGAEEGENVFPVRVGVAIVILVRNPSGTGPFRIRYSEIGSTLSRAQKLEKLVTRDSVEKLDSMELSSNSEGDWLSHRRDDFGTFVPVVSRNEKVRIFGHHSLGTGTNRDAWVYNFAKSTLLESMSLACSTYKECLVYGRTNDESKIKWSSSLIPRLERGEQLAYTEEGIRTATYRPFERLSVYGDQRWLHRPGCIREAFPDPAIFNQGIALMTPAPAVEFASLSVDSMPDLNLFTYPVQFAPRWRYDVSSPGTLNFDSNSEPAPFTRIDNITDEALALFQARFGSTFSTDDVYNYVYGVLNSADYRETYSEDLKKMLPRIPLVEDPWPFVNAGRLLSDLHLGYETVEPYPLEGIDTEPLLDPYDFFAVQKMSFAKVRNAKTKKLEADKTSIVYNSQITLSGIPEAAYRYMLGSRSAIEWIIDRYQVKTDKASGIVNDPNDWSREVEDPRYIIDLLARIVTVSLETMQIVDSLPALAIREDQGDG